MNEQAIGIFDSGIGGLSCVAPIIQKMPHESIIFFGDSARAPYGDRPKEDIIRFSLQIADYLVKQNCKALVIACNTISAVALEAIKEKHPGVPVIGIVESGAKAIAESKVSSAVVLSTTATAKSEAYPKAASKLCSTKIKSKACPSFVPIVEAGENGTQMARMAVRNELEELYRDGNHTFVLACTHYPFIRGDIEAVYPDVTIIDPAQALAEKVYKDLSALNLLSDGMPTYKFGSSKPTEVFESMLERVACGRKYSIYETTL